MIKDWPEWLPLRATLRSRTPYGAPQVDAAARLNTNENPYSIPESVSRRIEESIREVLRNLNRYPDRDVIELRRAIATYVMKHLGPGNQAQRNQFEVSEANIWPANGSNEVLQSILLAFGESVAGFTPSYSMHPILTEAVGKPFKQVPLKSDFTPDLELLRGFLAAKRPTIFFLTTPNNPTGRSVTLETVREIALMTAENGGLLVVDEAYGEFSAVPSAINLIAEIPSIVVVRTMSKAFAFAGARVGYAIARPEVVDALQLVRLPYHLSAITQAAAIAALREDETLLSEVEEIKRDRNLVAAELASMGFEVIPSDANFILFRGFTSIPSLVGQGSGDLWRALLDQGVLIRDVGIPGALRVTIGRKEENEAFINALRRLIAG
ncbi:MAG: histidinol-phosphate transaminase [Candidatus Nanopelagicaceae bacterium]|jgi:histidinol-phosphate aminotransferase